MAEENSGAQADVPVQPSMKILNQYIRDLSFENIAAQNNMGGEFKPEITVQVNLDANKKADNSYEVILKLVATATSGEQSVFLLEIEYAGLFVLENLPDEQVHPYLMIECPRMMFPFVRRIARDVTADGGFPPLNIDSIDFLALYRAEVQRRAASVN